MKVILSFVIALSFILCPISPVIVLGDSFKPADLDLKDVDVYEYAYRNWPNANWAKWTSIAIKSRRGTRRRVYIWFDTNKLKAKSGRLDKVELVLQGYLNTGNKTKINIYRVTKEWNAGTGTYHSGQVEPTARNSEITWNNQPAWDGKKIWSFTYAESKTMTPIKFDITTLVKSWASGKHRNYGLVIVGEREESANYQVTFSSSETPKEEDMPQILVNEDNKKCNKTLWGTQAAGWGHAKNAVLDGNTLILDKAGTIISQKGENAGYAIWSKGKAFLVVRAGETSVGKILPAGKYRVIAGLGQKLKKARIELCIH
jgi:hypothetical protein